MKLSNTPIPSWLTWSVVAWAALWALFRIGLLTCSALENWK